MEPLSAAWEKKGGALEALREPSDQELAPTSAGDIDGDGTIDLLAPEHLLRRKTGFLDCGC